MKTQTENNVGIVESIKAIAYRVASSIVCFKRGKDGQAYTFQFDTAELPWGDPTFVEKLVHTAAGGVAYRNKSGLSALPSDGMVTAGDFAEAILGMKFQGGAKPSEADLALAARAMVSVEADPDYAANAVAQIQAVYHRTIQPTMSGFAMHFMRKRLDAEAESKNKPTALSTADL